MNAVSIGISLALCVLMIAAEWVLFTKAGEKGWKSLIPVYSSYVLWKISWKATWAFWVMLACSIGASVIVYAMGGFDASGAWHPANLAGMPAIGALLLSLVTCVLSLVCAYKLMGAFGHGAGWFIGYLFVPIVFLPMLAFGSSEYQGARD